MRNPVSKIKRVGLTVNPDKVGARQLIRRTVGLIQRENRVVLMDSATANLVDPGLSSAPNVAALAEQSDILIVFGGDGTMLGAARAVAGLKTPILGVNVGGLGFLTALPSQRLAKELHNLWLGNFEIEDRLLIECTGNAGGDELFQVALNDFVISRGATSRLIELEVKVNGETLTNYRCDGLIVSSPTGSTAYSLAAGGAIVSPEASVLTITPICPHTLSNRSVIISSDAVVEVKVLSARLEIFLTADGQVQLPLFFGNTVQIRKSSRKIRLLRLPGSTFFNTLRQKLHWSGSHL